VSLALGAAQLALGQVDRAQEALNRATVTAGELGAPVLGLWAATLWPGARAPETSAAIASPDPSRLRRPRVTAAPAPAPPAVRLRCLGGFELSTDHLVVDSWQLRPRARSLLMMLALHHGHSVHREQLVEALWPAATLASGIRTLQVAVSSIRSCLASAGLPDDSLRRYGTAYALQLAGVHDQLAEFAEHARAAERVSGATDPRLALDLRLAALELYTGDLLPEVGPAEWAVGERDRLRQLAAALGSGAADLAGSLGELELGMRAARRSLELVPFQDHAWMQLADLQERLGDPSAAQLTRREHRRVCAELMRTEPRAIAGQRLPAGRGHHRAAPVRSRSPARRGS
jgi:DNA-binding SARP family transcriptional activator